MPFTLIRKFEFDAVHRLPHVPSDHASSKMHEHHFEVELVVVGEVDPNRGWVMDYGEIDKIFNPIRDQLADRCLNEVEGLENPSSEILAQWVFRRVKPLIPQLDEVRIAETKADSTRYRED